jgi:hypothetical protein
MDALSLVPLLFWLVMAGLVAAQAISGVALNGLWQPAYRRDQSPGQFRTVISLQAAIVMIVGIAWLRIILSER